ncbi:hypothetical protein BRI6_0920 [plant metagenome]|uniref:Uncharacterized protein n=1 Tax=plant metagenome TaxID=1297885 RepID=A0A484RYE7_9ZZZZ
MCGHGGRFGQAADGGGWAARRSGRRPAGGRPSTKRKNGRIEAMRQGDVTASAQPCVPRFLGPPGTGPPSGREREPRLESCARRILHSDIRLARLRRP